MNQESLKPLEPETEKKESRAENGVPQEVVIEKTEQSVRILSSLWEKRLDILQEYYKERNKKRFIPFKSDDSILSEIRGVLSRPSSINEREEKVIEILERGATSFGKEKLQTEGGAANEFNGKIDSVSKVIDKYTELVSDHKGDYADYYFKVFTKLTRRLSKLV